MAVNPKLGTFMGQPVKHYHSGRPVVGDMMIDHLTLTTKIFDGTDWYEITNEDLGDNLRAIESRWQNRRQITDEYLESEYPDLKPLREEYEQMRDKYKVFEILRQDAQS